MFQPPWVSGSQLKANRTRGKAQSGMMGRETGKKTEQNKVRRTEAKAAGRDLRSYTAKTHPEEEDFSEWPGGQPSCLMHD